jgi:hypothetical protein
MPCEAHRDDRGRCHARVERRQLEKRPLQVRPVVEVRAQYDLRVHPDRRLRESLEPRQDFGGMARPAEQRVPQLGIGRVDRDVERREALLEDPLERSLVEVAQRDVVSVQERQSVIVVLHVEAPTHSPGQLVDEAEDALVGARRDVARPRRCELEPEIGAAPIESPRDSDAVALDGQLEPLVAAVKVKVDHITEPVAVDRDDPIAGNEPRRGRGRSRSHGGDGHAARLSDGERLQESPPAPRRRSR